MIRKLVETYESGSITGCRLMIDCLQIFDPRNRDSVLSELPGEVLDEMLAHARRYDPRRARSADLNIPAEDQVRMAERRICARKAMSPKPVKQ
jgi:hypothetical protein